jgi:hypothetical protein
MVDKDIAELVVEAMGKPVAEVGRFKDQNNVTL